MGRPLAGQHVPPAKTGTAGPGRGKKTPDNIGGFGKKQYGTDIATIAARIKRDRSDVGAAPLLFLWRDEARRSSGADDSRTPSRAAKGKGGRRPAPEPRAAEGEHGEEPPLARSEHDGPINVGSEGGGTVPLITAPYVAISAAAARRSGRGAGR